MLKGSVRDTFVQGPPRKGHSLSRRASAALDEAFTIPSLGSIEILNEEEILSISGRIDAMLDDVAVRLGQAL